MPFKREHFILLPPSTSTTSRRLQGWHFARGQLCPTDEMVCFPVSISTYSHVKNSIFFFRHGDFSSSNFLSIHTIRIGTLHFTVFLVPTWTYKLIDGIRIGTLHFTVFFTTNLDLRIGMDGILNIKKNSLEKKKNGVFHVGIGRNRYWKTYKFIGSTSSTSFWRGTTNW